MSDLSDEYRIERIKELNWCKANYNLHEVQIKDVNSEIEYLTNYPPVETPDIIISKETEAKLLRLYNKRKER